MGKRSLSLFMTLLVFVLIQHGFTQSNEIIDQLLDQEQATLGNAAYLVFLAAGVGEEDWSPAQSITELQSGNWGFDQVNIDTPVDLGSLSFLLMQAFDLKGGIMYSLLPGRRYAAREYAYLGFVPGSASPNRILSGQEVTNILGRTLDHLGEREVE